MHPHSQGILCPRRRCPAQCLCSGRRTWPWDASSPPRTAGGSPSVTRPGTQTGLQEWVRHWLPHSLRTPRPSVSLAPHHCHRRCCASSVPSGLCSSPWSSDPRPVGRYASAAPSPGVDLDPNPSVDSAPSSRADLSPSGPLLTSRNCFSFSFSLPGGTLHRTAFSAPLGDSWLRSLQVSGDPSAPWHQHPEGMLVLGRGCNSLVLDLRAGASRP